MNLIQLADDIKKKKKKTGSPKKEETMPIDCLQTQAGVSSLFVGLRPAGFGTARLHISMVSLFLSLSLTHTQLHNCINC